MDTTSHASYNGTLRLAEQSDAISYVYTRPKSDDKEAGGGQTKEAETPRQLHGGVR